MTKILVGFLLVAGLAIQPHEPPQIVEDRLDCSGYEIHLADGEVDKEYMVALLGSTQFYAWFDYPYPMRSGDVRVFEWPQRWVYCYLKWDTCPELYLETQPDKIEWRWSVHYEGEMLSETTADLALPCGFRLYLPMIFK